MTSAYGALSILPIFAILVIAVITKRTLFAMACGLGVAAILLTEGGLVGTVNTWIDYIYQSMANDSLQWLLVVIAMFGMLIHIFEKSRAVTDFGIWAGKFIKTKKMALFGTFIMGVIIFIDDYLNNLAVGTTMKGITDRLKIPRTQLAYVVNSVAAPVCVLIPLSSWAVFFAGLMEKGGVTIDGSGLKAYIHAIPYTFYGYIALLVVILHILGIIPKMGLIKKDSIRAEETGNVFPEGTDPDLVESTLKQIQEEKNLNLETSGARPYNFLIPLISMIVVTLLLDGDVLIGAMSALLVCGLLYIVQRKLSFFDYLTACFEGVESMSFVMILCVLAFAVQAANLDLNLAEYVIGITKPIMHGGFLPAAVFIVCAVYAYATGCFWDLAAIILPIVIPLAQAMNADPILACAAVFSGAAFGSNTCLYGDGVIICAQGCQIKSIDLMFATLPYALIAGGISAVLYLIFGFITI